MSRTYSDDTQDTLSAAGAPVGVSLPPRYSQLVEIGTGGMGVVYRAWDEVLERAVAVKVGRAGGHLGALEREARLAAAIQDPRVIPVHDLGRTVEGAPYFTMDLIRGRSLSQLLGGRRVTDDGLFTRALGWFQQVCLAVARAHATGVLHLDLKPDNVMIGEYDDVCVIDFGIAERPADGQRTGPRGTPAYMAPEQVAGGALTAAADIYGLGGILFHLLTGEAPFPLLAGEDWSRFRARRLASPTPVPGERVAGPLPKDLEALCRACLHTDPAARPAEARVVADAVASHLEGVTRRREAAGIAATATRLLAEADLRRAEAAEQEARLDAERQRVPRWAPPDERAPLWALARSAERARADATRLEGDALGHYERALGFDPAQPEAKAGLTRLYQARMDAAERRGDLGDADAWRALLERFPDPELAAWLGGHARVHLTVDPPGARLTLARFTPGPDGRRVAEPLQALTPAALRDTWLPMGSYLLSADAPGHAPAVYPFVIRRRADWGPFAPLSLRPAASVLPGFVHIPAGPTTLGGDPFAPQAGPARSVVLGDFAMAVLPVSMAEYAAWIRDRFQVDPAGAWAAVSHGPRGEALWVPGPDGAPTIPERDPDGDAWDPEWPVFGIRWEDAHAYAAWYAARCGRRVRLPTEDEWEKAARGVDARAFPWGDTFDPSFCKMAESRPPSGKKPEPRGAFPLDVSVYGVRDLAGSMACWCDGTVPGTRLRPVRGGAWSFFEENARCARRKGVLGSSRSFVYGIRLVQELDPATHSIGSS